MNSTLCRQADFAVSQWAGGTTTELCIWPPTSTCAGRDFLYRVSSATVDLPESTFSDFSGFTRHIMPLAGHMALWHNGTPAANLTPYEGHTFDGSWTTRSVGACVDFNLIHHPSMRGALHVVRQNESLVVPPGSHMLVHAQCDDLLIMVHDGTACAAVHTLQPGDALVLHQPEACACAQIVLACSGTVIPAVLAVVATVEDAGRNTA